ncbi:hypothetical protein J2783_001143 [Chryseobacterium sediminis]|nr:hypothetical protein [Chryseobacterium sediminis]
MYFLEKKPAGKTSFSQNLPHNILSHHLYYIVLLESSPKIQLQF